MKICNISLNTIFFEGKCQLSLTTEHSAPCSSAGAICGLPCTRPPPRLASGMIQCDCCGKNYQRRVYKNKNAWNCSTFTRRGKKYCPTSKQIPEDVLYQVLCDVLEIKEFDEDVVHIKISRILVPAPYELIFIFHDGHKEKRKWEHISRSKSWTDEMKQKARERSLQCQGKSQ